LEIALQVYACDNNTYRNQKSVNVSPILLE